MGKDLDFKEFFLVMIDILRFNKFNNPSNWKLDYLSYAFNFCYAKQD